MSRLRDLPNLGPASEAMLTAAGIRSPDDLVRLGAVAAYRRVQQAGGQPSLNLLYALEGALQGRHWTSVRRDIGPDLIFAVESWNEAQPD